MMKIAWENDLNEQRSKIQGPNCKFPKNSIVHAHHRKALFGLTEAISFGPCTCKLPDHSWAYSGHLAAAFLLLYKLFWKPILRRFLTYFSRPIDTRDLSLTSHSILSWNLGNDRKIHQKLERGPNLGCELNKKFEESNLEIENQEQKLDFITRPCIYKFRMIFQFVHCFIFWNVLGLISFALIWKCYYLFLIQRPSNFVYLCS